MGDHKINPILSAPIDTPNDSSGAIKAVIFDLGNVLIDFNHKLAAEKISGFSDRTPKQIFDLFFDSGLTGLFEEGHISPEDFFLKIKEQLGLRLDYAEFVPIYNGIFFLTEKNHSVYNLTRILKDHYKLALLSNINVLHFDYLKKNFPVFDAFHHIVTSYGLGLRKPHPLIYQKTLEILRVCPQQAFYTDDRPELIRGAQELGIRSFVFKNMQQLKSDLLSTGISIN